MEENGSIQKVDLFDSTEASVAEVSVADPNSTTVPSATAAAGYEQAKERLQRFDLVIQHLHRLRATLALDSSVRELQKLQTLNILGQSLMPSNSRTGQHVQLPPLPLLPPPPHPPPPIPPAGPLRPPPGGGPAHHPNFLSLRPPMPPRMPEPFFANGQDKMGQHVKSR